MKYIEILDNLKVALAIRLSDQKVFRKRIAEILEISISMVSRKLSGKTHFTVEEISILCEELEIPIDEIFNRYKNSIKQPLQVFLHDFFSRQEESRVVFNWTIEMFSLAGRSDNSTFYLICNTFPDMLHSTFDWIARFSKLQWILLNRGIDALIPLSELVEIPENRKLMNRYISAIHSLKRSVYLISHKVMENYIMEIRKFYLLGYITKEETACLLQEAEEILELFENICFYGRLENGKEMEIYCTDMFLPGDMYILKSNTISLGMFHTTPLNPVITKSPDVCNTMKKWFEVWRRSATLISQSGTYIRKQFMNIQHEAIDKFKAEIGL